MTSHGASCLSVYQFNSLGGRSSGAALRVLSLQSVT